MRRLSSNTEYTWEIISSNTIKDFFKNCVLPQLNNNNFILQLNDAPVHSADISLDP
jgi:hypothetical protein